MLQTLVLVKMVFFRPKLFVLNILSIKKEGLSTKIWGGRKVKERDGWEERRILSSTGRTLNLQNHGKKEVTGGEDEGGDQDKEPDHHHHFHSHFHSIFSHYTFCYFFPFPPPLVSLQTRLRKSRVRGRRRKEEKVALSLLAMKCGEAKKEQHSFLFLSSSFSPWLSREDISGKKVWTPCPSVCVQRQEVTRVKGKAFIDKAKILYPVRNRERLSNLLPLQTHFLVIRHTSKNNNQVS